MPDDFSSLSLERRGEHLSALELIRDGIFASAGTFQVFPVRKAPSIFPEAHQFLAVLSDTLCFVANSHTEIKSISARNIDCSYAKIIILAVIGNISTYYLLNIDLLSYAKLIGFGATTKLIDLAGHNCIQIWKGAL